LRITKTLAQILGATNAICERKDDPERGKLLWTYWRVKVKHLLLARLLRRRMTSERVLGCSVSFFDYAHFAYLFEEIFVNQDYAFPTANDAPFILDCGSNIGMAILFFKRRHPNARILAFEPDPATFRKLEANVTGNGLADVTLVNKAVSDRDGVLTFYHDPEDPGMLLMTPRGRRHEKWASTEVQATALSGYVTGPVDFLKLDVEGAEDDAMKELAATGKLALIKQMVIEYHHHLDAERDNLSEMLGLLEENGFGYQVGAPRNDPFPGKRFQDILIYAYAKEPGE